MLGSGLFALLPSSNDPATVSPGSCPGMEQAQQPPFILMELREIFQLKTAALGVIESNLLVTLPKMPWKAVCCCLLCFPVLSSKRALFPGSNRELYARDGRIFEALSTFQVGASKTPTFSSLLPSKMPSGP